MYWLLRRKHIHLSPWSISSLWSVRWFVEIGWSVRRQATRDVTRAAAEARCDDNRHVHRTLEEYWRVLVQRGKRLVG